LLRVQQVAADKSSTIARDSAIKQMEIAVDMVKFAIGEVSKLRLGIASALADFIRAWWHCPKQPQTSQSEGGNAPTSMELQRILYPSASCNWQSEYGRARN